MKRLLRRVLYPVAAAALAATLFGCAKDDGDVTNPNPEVFKPKGMVQGLLVDSVTQQPIVGAVVDIGVATAKTNERGQFVLRDVPVNQNFDDPNLINDNSDSDNYYSMTIDLRGVSSPVDMRATTTTVKYPEFKYDWVQLAFTSLNDTDGSTPGAGSGSNHDTPVDGLVANVDLSVGKLSAAVKGCVVLSSTNQLVADADGYTVRLRTGYGSDNSASGSSSRVLATATVVGGQYTFSNIEALGSFYVEAFNAAGTMFGSQSFSTSVDGVTTDLTCATGSCNALLVGSTDECAPFIVSRSVANGADLAPAANQTVVYTFSEPIKATAYALATDAGKAAIAGLWNDVDVEFEGGKSGNIAHTLSWNTEMTQLTVTIAQTAVSSIYTVDLSDAVSSLKDAANNELTDPRNLDFVRFSTNGGAVAAAPADLVVSNKDFIDAGTEWAYLDWTPASGAKSYNIYCAYEQLWADDSNAHQFEFVDNVESTDASVYLGGLVENNQIALQALCYVVGVNSDGLEGAASPTVTISDVTPPEVVDVDVDGFTAPADGEKATFTIDVDFSEPMNEALAEDVANYAIAKNADAATTDADLTILSAEYDVGSEFVELTVQLDNTAGGLTYSGNWTLTVDSALTDVAGIAMEEDFVYDNGVQVLPVTLVNGAVQGQGVGVKANDGSTGYFNTVLLYDATGDQLRLPATPYTVNVGEESVARLTWAPVGNSTFTVYHYKKTLNGVDDMDFVGSNFVGHDTFFVGAPLNFEETAPWSSLQHFPVVHYYQVEAHLADSSVNDPGSYDLIARSELIPVSDKIGPYISAVDASDLPALITDIPNDGLTYEYEVIVTFNEPVKLAGLETPTFYAFTPAGTAVATDRPMTITKAEYADDLDSNHKVVRLTVAISNPDTTADDETLLTKWVLTVTGVQDLAGNGILASGNQWASDLSALTATTVGARLTGSPAAIDPAGLFNPF